jgi:putative transposase
VHVTLRRGKLLPSFRSQSIVIAFEERLSKASSGSFRVLQYSLQGDHVHLVVEASDRSMLSRGMQGLAIRLARGFNTTVRRRGKVWGDRFHARELASPREVRAALVYVLMNHKKHRAVRVDGAGRMESARGNRQMLDAFSSAFWFDGWSSRASPWVVGLRARLPTQIIPVARPRTWLARTGWRQFGLVRPEERPASS